MSSKHDKVKKFIINTFINSGINISPEVLEIFQDMENIETHITNIIRNVSFLPQFKSHLTPEILKKLEIHEIQTILKRKFTENVITSESHELELEEQKAEHVSTELKEDKNENIKETSPATTINSSYPGIKPINLDEISFDTPSSAREELISKKKILKQAPLTGNSLSTFAFKPIARDYPPVYEILKDPTGKLHTSGEYKDFYELTLDKFNSLRKLMRKRPDVSSTINIKNLVRSKNKVEVSIIGLINEIRTTKNGNYLVTLEDLSGSIKVLIKKEQENLETTKLVERMLEDQLIYVKGMYAPDKSNNKGLVYANNVLKIDVPLDAQQHRSQDPLSVALISDTHIGSREFEEKLWKRFVKILNGNVPNKGLREKIGKIKYLIINGDLVDGIGVYPDQKGDLIISDIHEQYKVAAEFLSQIPSYIKIFYSSGNHEPVRNAIPRPAVPKKYCKELLDIGVEPLGNPSYIQTHGVITLIFHGDSLLDMSLLVPGLENNNPIESMKELLICRHLAPVYGKKTQIAPVKKDWLIIDTVPDIFHTGHLHINGYGKYRNVSLINSGCFQSQTDYMRSMGIHPTEGKVPIMELDTFQYLELNLNEENYFL